MPADGSDRHLSFPDDFRIGDWLVEPSLDRLSRGDTVIHLRTQLTNLLVLFAHNPGRTVSKEEILARIWEGQFVAESGMTRCIAEIRQALGDDAHDPKILQTITKRGYRLLAPVTPVPRPADANSLPQPARATLEAPDTAATNNDAPHESPEASFSPLMDGHTNPGLPRTLPSDASKIRARHRPVRLAVVSVFTVAAVSALGWFIVGWVRPPVLSERDTVLLADVTNTTGDPGFDQTLRLALGMHLGQASFLRILPDSLMRSGLDYMGRPRNQVVTGPVALELCRREGAAVLLAGSIARMASHYAIGLEAVACGSGESLGREMIEVENKDGVLGAVSTAARRIRAVLGESRASIRRSGVPIVEATTPSLEALEALSLGDQCRDNERLSDALTYYRRATDLDPKFALAWARRGAAAHNMGRAVGDDRSAETEETRISFLRAWELRDGVSEVERFYILGHYYRFVEGDVDKTVDTYKTWIRSVPGSVVPETNLASVYVNTLGLYSAALGHAREAVRLAPSSSVANGVLVVTLLGVGRVDEAQAALRDAARNGVSDLSWHRLAFELAVTTGDERAMAEQVQWASQDPAAAMVMSEYEALADASRGRLREARLHWADATVSAAKAGTAGLRAGTLLRQAEAEALLGDPKRARAATEQALALDGQPTTRLAAATVFALAGDPGRASRLLDEATRTTKGTSTATYVWQPVARALVLSGLGRPEDALLALASTVRYERGRYYGLAPLGVRGSIQRSAAHPQQAEATFRELLSLRVVVPMSPWVAYARLGLARALREAGELEASRTAYEELLEWMATADEDAPVGIAARRERAALASTR